MFVTSLQSLLLQHKQSNKASMININSKELTWIRRFTSHVVILDSHLIVNPPPVLPSENGLESWNWPWVWYLAFIEIERIPKRKRIFHKLVEHAHVEIAISVCHRKSASISITMPQPNLDVSDPGRLY